MEFASVWHGDFDSLGANSIGVTLRYDDTFSPGIAAGNVQLWTYDGASWDASLTSNLDVSDRLLSATVAPTDWFAVSTLSDTSLLPQSINPAGPNVVSTNPVIGVEVPEPASAAMALIAGSALMLRRRRNARA